MSSRTETLTILPALFLFLLASYLAFFTFQVGNPSTRQGLAALALSLFVGGLVLTFHWGYYWVISKRLRKNKSGSTWRVPSFGHLISLSLIAACMRRLLEKVKDLVPTSPQKDKEEKNEKDGPPVKPAEKKEKGSSGCPYHFGYLSERPKKSPIPEECLTCQKMLECRNKSSLA